jgi:hypothetical protein
MHYCCMISKGFCWGFTRNPFKHASIVSAIVSTIVQKFQQLFVTLFYLFWNCFKSLNNFKIFLRKHRQMFLISNNCLKNCNNFRQNMQTLKQTDSTCATIWTRSCCALLWPQQATPTWISLSTKRWQYVCIQRFDVLILWFLKSRWTNRAGHDVLHTEPCISSPGSGCLMFGRTSAPTCAFFSANLGSSCLLLSWTAKQIIVGVWMLLFFWAGHRVINADVTRFGWDSHGPATSPKCAWTWPRAVAALGVVAAWGGVLGCVGRGRGRALAGFRAGARRMNARRSRQNFI